MSVQKKSMIALNTNFIIVLWFFLSGLRLAPYQDESYGNFKSREEAEHINWSSFGVFSILVCEFKLEGKIKS